MFIIVALMEEERDGGGVFSSPQRVLGGAGSSAFVCGWALTGAVSFGLPHRPTGRRHSEQNHPALPMVDGCIGSKTNRTLKIQ